MFIGGELSVKTLSRTGYKLSKTLSYAYSSVLGVLLKPRDILLQFAYFYFILYYLIGYAINCMIKTSFLLIKQLPTCHLSKICDLKMKISEII